MRRQNWLLGALTIAATLASFSPSVAQQIECCTYNVTHHFRVCLPPNCRPQVLWSWQTQAAAWQIGFSPVINQNNGSQVYAVPSSDSKCANAVYGQECAFSTACASFSTSLIPGTNCVQGVHRAVGRACVRCRRHGANAQSSSKIIIACRFQNPFGVQWAPVFQDQVGGGCGVQMIDPVYVKLRSPNGETRNELLFDLRASGINWEASDTNGDGFPDVARLKGSGPIRGNITLLKRTAGPQGGGGESRLVIRYENGIVTEVVKTGEFRGLQLPNVGDPMPGPDSQGIEVPASLELRVELPQGWEAEEIEMGGGGDAGEPVPTLGDVNGDGCVDDADLLIVLFNFGGQGGVPGDVNGDGIVDDADLLIVLFNLGLGCLSSPPSLAPLPLHDPAGGHSVLY
ncbi:MAG: hypothetical protein N2651_05845, partial [Fimbriimonadales bacterium]|nr:hypothetical protein [Fimbriimonadales bacterium]